MTEPVDLSRLSDARRFPEPTHGAQTRNAACDALINAPTVRIVPWSDTQNRAMYWEQFTILDPGTYALVRVS